LEIILPKKPLRTALCNKASLKYFVMWVLSVRSELIAYYERRGYVQTV
jgi:hypothetical protein